MSSDEENQIGLENAFNIARNLHAIAILNYIFPGDKSEEEKMIC